jgi:hypothetical protein
MPPRAAAKAAKVRHLTPQQLSERFGGPDAGVSVATLRDWRNLGRGPDYIRGESDGDKATILYPENWVEEWEESRRVRHAQPA